MLRRFMTQCAYAVFVVFCVVTVVFFITRLSGDPAALMVPPSASQQDIELLRHEMGFDQSLGVQYLNYMSKAVTGDFGVSYRHNQPAMQLVLDRLPATIKLTSLAMAIALIMAIPLGILSATKRNSFWDHSSLVVSLVGQSFPVFWFGIMLIMIFSEWLHLLPASGSGSILHLIMPAITLSSYTMAMVTRLLRSGLLEVLGADYVRTARAKGLTERVVLLRHALKNAAIPVITVIGLQIGPLLGGAVITETVFAYPGMGRLAIQAISNRDFTVIQAFVVIMAVIIVTVNLLTDVIYTLVDPRIKSS